MTRAVTSGAVRAHSRARRGWRISGSIVRLLRLLVAVPLLAVIGFAGLALQGTVRQVVTAGTAYDLVTLSAQAGALTRALQAERVTAAVELTTRTEAASTTFEERVGSTDVAIAEFQRQRAEVSSAAAILQRVDAGLNALSTVREQVRSSPRASLSAIAFSYRILIADLLAFRASVATDSSARVADDVRAAVAVAEAGEAIGQLQIIVLRSLAGGELTPAGQQESAGAQARFAEAGNSFLDLAEPGYVARWEQIGTNPQVVAAQRLQDEVGRTLPGKRLAVEADAWVTATDGWIGQMFQIQAEADEAVADAVAAERGQRMRDALLQSTGMLLVLALTAVLTGVVARRITRRLRSLRNTVAKVAYDRLPAVVRELDAAPPGTVRPDEVADRSVSEFRITGSDEIAEVATATRALHREAVRIAGEQAVMRSNVAEIFVHLSRREQRLVDAILAQVDQVERDEADPERLQQLYRLDHLATRMARINQSLLVLGGSGISRVRQEPVPLDHVIQAALSQIEHYTRVRIGAVDEELCVVGGAVDEVVHLLAELLDNATAYSPPETEVLVTGHGLSDRAIVEVMDQGVGLSAQRCAQLNDQLTAPATVDASGVRAMGLTVVARLAARHGVRVELRPGTPVGTVAEIGMPASIILRRPVQRPDPVRRLDPAGHPELAERPELVESLAAGRVRASTAQGRLPTPAAVGWAATPSPVGAGQPRSGPAPAAPLFRPSPSTPTGTPPSTPTGTPTSTVAASADPEDSTAAASTAEVGTTAPAPAAEVGTTVVEQADRRAVNGWFKTAFDGESVPVTWPTDAGERWAAATRTLSTRLGPSPAQTGTLPRRVPQHHLIPDAPQAPAETPRKLDPAAVSAAMSAYAKGVAGHRAPASS